MAEVDIAIVGGGLGGLALALGLQERGIQAHVFEKAPKVRVHSGTAISLAVNGNSTHVAPHLLSHPILGL
jgi:2-polyprenyl-6-methoxyphenol hydroxylase-like FAD-dependent oxidoreductase